VDLLLVGALWIVANLLLLPYLWLIHCWRHRQRPQDGVAEAPHKNVTTVEPQCRYQEVMHSSGLYWAQTPVSPAVWLRRENMGGYSSESRITAQVEEAAALRCGCGHGIHCEVRRAGEHLGFLVFVDDEPTSETCGERIESCPGCGEQLGFPMLFPKNRTA
jgi:hypothetical protein